MMHTMLDIKHMVESGCIYVLHVPGSCSSATWHFGGSGPAPYADIYSRSYSKLTKRQHFIVTGNYALIKSYL